jgi:hypothetical protein
MVNTSSFDQTMAGLERCGTSSQTVLTVGRISSPHLPKLQRIVPSLRRAILFGNDTPPPLMMDNAQAERK